MLVDSSVVFGHVDKDIEGTLTIKNDSTVHCYSKQVLSTKVDSERQNHEYFET